MVVIEATSSSTPDPTNPHDAVYSDTSSDHTLDTMSSAPDQDSSPAIALDLDPPEEHRGRLKRRRLSSHSPARAPSPSRGHDRDSGSRHRHHYRKHHRPSSPSSSLTPPASAKKHRRRSDAEPDHTLRGRVRNRSGERRRTESPLLEGDTSGDELDVRSYRKRSAPPSRHRIEDEDDDSEGIRRQRSYPNLYKEERRDSKGDDAVMDSIGKAEEDGLPVRPAVPPL